MDLLVEDDCQKKKKKALILLASIFNLEEKLLVLILQFTQ